ncbi:MAG: cytidylate kinase-like family protein [Clostridia bacterium]|nr:cytidylate kinase-like family protein [Clostridia bacterium]
MYPIITISREFGSGGHTIGAAVAEKLGIPFYDSVIVDQTAMESGYTKEVVSHSGEYLSFVDKWFSANAFSGGYVGSHQDKIYAIQKRIILEAASKGPCVIVGRCADHILEEQGIPILNIFIYADMEYRKQHVLEHYGETDVPIEKRLKKKDKGRKAYYRRFTDRDWGDYTNYRLCLDSGYLEEQTCVDIIIRIAQEKSK